MITVENLAIDIGSRRLMGDVSFVVNPGDKIGLIGRNGAGKTTLTKVLSGEVQPSEGRIFVKGKLGFLPQDPRTGNLQQSARERVLDARELGTLTRKLREASERISSSDPAEAEKAMGRFSRLTDRFHALGGYAAESEAATIMHNLGLADTVLDQPLETLSGGQRRRVELARILFSDAETLILDEPTNHLDADSIVWLRNFLRAYRGGVVVISHDVSLIDETVNRVFYLDATRQVIDIYNMRWKKYLRQRAADEERRRKERANAQRKATQLKEQAARFGAKATKAAAAHQMVARAERLLEGLEEQRQDEKVANLRFPKPKPCGKTPIMAEMLSKSYGSLEIFAGVDLAIDRSSRVAILGLNGAGKTTLLRLLAGVDEPSAGHLVYGHGACIGYYAQEHETLDVNRSVLENMLASSDDLTEAQARNVLGSFLFQGDDVHKPAGVLSGGEKTRLALAALVVSGANVLLLDEPTNNLDPASREEVLAALATYEGAVVLVSHDVGAVRALSPDRVLIMPEATEDLWSDDYYELIELA